MEGTAVCLPFSLAYQNQCEIFDALCCTIHCESKRSHEYLFYGFWGTREHFQYKLFFQTYLLLIAIILYFARYPLRFETPRQRDDFIAFCRVHFQVCESPIASALRALQSGGEEGDDQ